jgi:hypothetical protein
MRLNHPNDELGSMLLLLLPQLVVHEIDAASPLMPPPYWCANQNTALESPTSANTSNAAPVKGLGLQPPQQQQQTSSRVHWQPPAYDHLLSENPSDGPPGVTGSSGLGGGVKGAAMYDPNGLSDLNFPAVTRRSCGSEKLSTMAGSEPVSYQQQFHQTYHAPTSALCFAEAHSTGGTRTSTSTGINSGSHTSAKNKSRSSGSGGGSGSNGTNSSKSSSGSRIPAAERRHFEEENRMVSAFMADRQMEIIAIVEGVDPTTGGTVQARHSFLALDEVEWNRTFRNCIYSDPADGCATVDFCRFHELRPVELDVAYAGEVSSIL